MKEEMTGHMFVYALLLFTVYTRAAHDVQLVPIEEYIRLNTIDTTHTQPWAKDTDDDRIDMVHCVCSVTLEKDSDDGPIVTFNCSATDGKIRIFEYILSNYLMHSSDESEVNSHIREVRESQDYTCIYVNDVLAAKVNSTSINITLMIGVCEVFEITAGQNFVIDSLLLNERQIGSNEFVSYVQNSNISITLHVCANEEEEIDGKCVQPVLKNGETSHVNSILCFHFHKSTTSSIFSGIYPTPASSESSNRDLETFYSSNGTPQLAPTLSDDSPSQSGTPQLTSTSFFDSLSPSASPSHIVNIQPPNIVLTIVLVAVLFSLVLFIVISSIILCVYLCKKRKNKSRGSTPNTPEVFSV